MLAETTMARDAALLRIHVMREKETVMALVMEVSMMDMLAVREILSVVPTIAENLVSTIMRKMTAVRSLTPCPLNLP